MPKVKPKSGKLKSELAAALSKSGAEMPGASSEPLWKGPEQDGITQSMLNLFLFCRERFRIRMIEGLQPADTFSHRIEYGQMWHVCEEHNARGDDWQKALMHYAKQLVIQYPTQSVQIEHWYNVCKAQFPIAVEYWTTHQLRCIREPLLQEFTFSVPYVLPSGRRVKLRGKIDAVELVTRQHEKTPGVFIQENKTKSDIDEQRIQQQLRFDMQTGIYIVALRTWAAGYDNLDESPQVKRIAKAICNGQYPLRGVLYNTVRRPLSGGKYSIRPNKATKKKAAETENQFFERLQGLIRSDPQFFFARWFVDITEQDMIDFEYQFLVPILESLCDWYEWVVGSFRQSGALYRAGNRFHFRTPYGVYNPVIDGGSSDLDEYLATGSLVGLRKVDSLFREL